MVSFPADLEKKARRSKAKTSAAKKHEKMKEFIFAPETTAYLAFLQKALDCHDLSKYQASAAKNCFPFWYSYKGIARVSVMFSFNVSRLLQ